MTESYIKDFSLLKVIQLYKQLFSVSIKKKRTFLKKRSDALARNQGLVSVVGSFLIHMGIWECVSLTIMPRITFVKLWPKCGYCRIPTQLTMIHVGSTFNNCKVSFLPIIINFKFSFWLYLKNIFKVIVWKIYLE